MTYTKKQFIEDVKKEARALREHATAKELAKLNIRTFDPKFPNTCVYGQLTGDCYSDRSHQLIKKCCIRFVDNSIFIPFTDPNSILNSINGKPRSVKQLNKDRKWMAPKYLSILEGYVMLPEAKNANLIDFLKGNRNDLVL